MSQIFFEHKFPKADIVPCEIHLVSVATSVTEVSWEGELSFSFGPNVHGYLPTCSFSRTCTCTHSTYTTSHNMEKGRRRWVGRVGYCPPRFWQINLPYLNQRKKIVTPTHIAYLPTQLYSASYVTVKYSFSKGGLISESFSICVS